MIGSGIEGDRRAPLGRAAGLNFQQLDRDVVRALGRLAPGLLPLLGTQPVQRRVLRVRSGVATDQMQIGDRNIELVAAGIGEHQKFGRRAAGLDELQTQIAADAVFLMHDRRAGAQIGEVADDGRWIARGGPACPRPRPFAGELAFADDGQIVQQEPPFQRRDGDGERLRPVAEFRPVRARLGP
jgi:hypothetical protein